MPQVPNKVNLVKDHNLASCSDVCIVGSGAIACDMHNNSWHPLEEQIGQLATNYGFYHTSTTCQRLHTELFCAWIGDQSRVVTQRLAHHLVLKIFNHRKKTEGEELLKSINQDLSAYRKSYTNSYVGMNYYDPGALSEAVGTFERLYQQWTILEKARKDLANLYMLARERLSIRALPTSIEKAMNNGWILTLNWDDAIYNSFDRVVQWHGLCHHPDTLILPTEVHDTLEIIRIIKIPDDSWMSDAEKKFYHWCLNRVEALHDAACKAHTLLAAAPTLWLTACALNTYDCELITAFSKAGIQNLKTVKIVNLKCEESNMRTRAEFLISRTTNIKFEYIAV